MYVMRPAGNRGRARPANALYAGLARVWYEWRYTHRVTTVADCRPCCNAGLLRAAAEGRALAGDVTMAPSYEEMGL
jgi:hypothetical protein